MYGRMVDTAGVGGLANLAIEEASGIVWCRRDGTLKRASLVLKCPHT